MEPKDEEEGAESDSVGEREMSTDILNHTLTPHTQSPFWLVDETKLSLLVVAMALDPLQK